MIREQLVEMDGATTNAWCFETWSGRLTVTFKGPSICEHLLLAYQGLTVERVGSIEVFNDDHVRLFPEPASIGLEVCLAGDVRLSVASGCPIDVKSIK